MKKELKNCLTKITIVTSIVGMPVAGFFVGRHIADVMFHNKQKDIQSQERFNGVSDLMADNGYNTPLTLDIKENEPLNVSLFNFTSDEREDAIKSIASLDSISQNIDYKIIDNDDTKVTQHIEISKISPIDMQELSGFDNIMGCTMYDFDTKNATIKYPVDIYINENVEGQEVVEGTSLMSFVIKHEMMHSLGFKDLYDSKYFNKTIMFYAFSSFTNIGDYTDFDKKNIKQVYDYTTSTVKEQYKNGNIKVNYPSFLQTYFDEKKKTVSKDNTDEYSL